MNKINKDRKEMKTKGKKQINNDNNNEILAKRRKKIPLNND